MIEMIVATVLAVLTAIAIYLVLWVVATTSLMWILFALNHLLFQWTEGKPGPIRWAGFAVDKAFWTLDVAFNLLTGTIWFFELPNGAPVWFIETFSARLRRHYRHEARGWRKHLAALFREPINLIDRDHI